MSKSKTVTGVVKWYQPQRGFGFIAGDDGVDYFARHSEIQMDGFRKLKRRQAVSFVPAVEDGEEKRPIAKEIEVTE